ncbi:tetratricopeptide repeat protein [Polyangium sp. y55x31]|uniref:tetratricopeptide repeat protein n=1 Tax=Polyangium sp. y55x31 TaxID=3042688 RepID=UPI0024830666|nr:tetratricopeptide repeat protein [Polyangium sp. y55x31]MDI1479027.1 tetratricopeptide repeat protein [Polyangium sp. y55x31]
MSFEPEALLGEDDGLVLRRFFEWGVGHGFDLAIVQITTPWKRDALIAWAKANVQGVAVIDLREVGPDKRRLWDVLREATALESGATSLILHGLEEAEAEERIVAQLNVERDELARGFPLPWLLIVHPTAAQVLERKAPDFVDFAGAWMWEEKPEPLRLELAAIDARYGVTAPMPMRDLGASRELLDKAGKAISDGHLNEAEDLLAQFDLRHPNARNEDPDRLSTGGRLLSVLGSPDEARSAFERALRFLEERGDVLGRAYVLQDLGSLDLSQDRYDEARHHLLSAGALFEEVNDLRGRAYSLHELSGLEAQVGRYEDSRRLCGEAIACFERLNDRWGRAAALHQLAIVESSLGRYEDARQLLREATEIFEQVGNRVGRAAALYQLALIEGIEGRLDEEQRLCREALRISEEVGDLRGRAVGLHKLASLAAAEGRYDEARPLIEQSIALRKRMRDRSGIAMSELLVGLLECAAGRFTEGRELVQAAVDTLQALGAVQAEEARSVLREIDALQHPPTPS